MLSKKKGHLVVNNILCKKMIRKRDVPSSAESKGDVSPLCPKVKKVKKDDVESRIERSMRDTIDAIGEDLERQGLVKTPLRAAKAMIDLTSGYKLSLKDVVNEAVFEAESQDMVVVRDIPFHSLCEHHVLPFYGTVHVGYVPRDTILGISKFARIVNMFAKRLQIQERLTVKIADAIQQTLNPLGVVVVVEASHMCMEMRGVQKIGSVTSTCSKLGVFREGQSTHAKEFWSHIRRTS